MCALNSGTFVTFWNTISSTTTYENSSPRTRFVSFGWRLCVEHIHFRTHCGCQVGRETKTHMQSSCAFRAIQQSALFAFRLHSINISSESVSATRPCRPRGQLRSPPSSSFAVLYINWHASVMLRSWPTANSKSRTEIVFVCVCVCLWGCVCVWWSLFVICTWGGFCQINVTFCRRSSPHQ